jgi:ribosome-associated protein
MKPSKVKLKAPKPKARPRAAAREREATASLPSAARPSEDAQRIALAAAEAGLDKKAGAVEIIDVLGKVDYADYLVLMTGQSDRHVAAIAEAVDSALSKRGFDAISVEGLPSGNWVLIDFVDVVVHVFQESTRSLYDLDGLWMDARRVPVPSGVS